MAEPGLKRGSQRGAEYVIVKSRKAANMALLIE